MKYTSINIQGNLISEEILQKIEEADVQGQLAKDFGLDPGINLRSEIEYAWSRIKLDWKHFYERTEKLPNSDPYGTTLSRRWMSGFFNTLGFELSLQKASLQGDNEQQYSISHTVDMLDGLPIHIVGFHDPNHPLKNTLDIRSSGGTSRLSPHATIQEFLNVTEHLYAMVTNGHLLRLVRDSGRLVKLTYIEFDLKRLLDEDKYSEFTLLYRLLHSSRFPKTKQETEESLLENYYQDSIESGNRIRDGLSVAVKESLIALANGLLKHPENKELRGSISSGRPDPLDFYHQLLRLIYRLLFLMVTEERDLVFADNQDNNQEPDQDDLLKGINHPTKKEKNIYYQYYSLVRLRKLSEKRYLQENQYTDLWQGLIQTFALFESGGKGIKLGILALGSELFSGKAMPDITTSKLNNKVLLQCIRSLNEFEDAKHNLSFINYKALDVEELGSVYEGLLELEPIFEWENGKPKFSFNKGSERSSSGSHYTPEDLVKPLIQHSLEYLIEDRTADFYKEKATKEETKKKLLDLKVCDVACGSGHILLSAARRIAIEVARVESGEQQPNPTSFRHALKEVIRNCIYGVDKNPLAVELCKVALWLESHNPGEPLSFLDHRIKCGDAIVGLAHREELQNGIANEAYKKLQGDDKEVISSFLNKNKQERILREKGKQAVQLTTATDYKLMEQVKELHKSIERFSWLPENTSHEIEHKEKEYRKLINSETFQRLKILTDLQIMPFFLGKTAKNKEYLLTDAQYNRYLRGEIKTPFSIESKANEIATAYRFFHWFLEFPEVFSKGGFHCILGNPPYLGGNKISRTFGVNYIEFLKNFHRVNGNSDLVVYFMRRSFSLLSINSSYSFIASQTIKERTSRVDGLGWIRKKNGEINFALTNKEWPGKASTLINIVAINNFRNKNVSNILNNLKVNYINSFLSDEEIENEPYKLLSEKNKGFVGCFLLGDGFILKENERKDLIHFDSKSESVIGPYLIGDDLNESPTQQHSRYAINFSGLTLEEAKKYEVCFHRIVEKVKPERDVNTYSPGARKKWWLYERSRPEMLREIIKSKKYLIAAKTSKHLCFIFREIDDNIILDQSLTIIPLNRFYLFSIVQSSLHLEWSRKYSTSSQAGTPRYNPSDTIHTFPFPITLKELQGKLEEIGSHYYKTREKIMTQMYLGLTKTFNLFHSKEIDISLDKDLSSMTKHEIEKLYSKEVWGFWNHLYENGNTCTFEEAVAGIIKLRELHVEMDYIVLHSYGWHDIDLKHDFYEVDYLPENNRIRFTFHPDARKEVLKRLLVLNHKIHEEEVKAGLWDKKSGNRVTSKSKTKANQANEGGYGGLFDK